MDVYMKKNEISSIINQVFIGLFFLKFFAFLLIIGLLLLLGLAAACGL